MDVRKKLSERFAGVEGGLFSNVTKADVGDGFSAMGKDKVTLMGWADPFYPDPSIPEHIKQVMIEEIQNGFPSHYIMPSGSLALRERVAKKLKQKNHLDVDPKRNILITPGSDSGLFYAMAVLLDQGDEVLVPDPSYPNNFLDPKLLGATAVSVPLAHDDGYSLDIEAFQAALTSRTKAVVLTHPNNPTTTVFRKENLEVLAEFVIKNDLMLVVDQAFEDSVFDDIEFITPASLPGMWERTITVFSISKGMGLSGFRVGYIAACDQIMDAMYGAAVNVLGASNTLAQLGAIAAFDAPDFIDPYIQSFDYRRKKAFEIFGSVPGVKIEMPESGFYCWVDVSGLGDSTDVMNYLVQEAKVAVNDGKNYGKQGNGHLRIIHGCLGSDEEAVLTMRRMADALVKYPKRNGE
ncbi:pyridoxal phosphate-dependent aminotransferase [Faecalicatena sp. AGMB00832]|uniref:Pyridoxal phosphate-dependent aminotransferase n=1 Tax=Faecalicatena faecalis TaxID=2726362 RepID=A0ABS6D6B3_9FIRM|nr:pyridoxal phosphate-dependent aminotransferase [Faecalicatena faecalis]